MYKRTLRNLIVFLPILLLLLTTAVLVCSLGTAEVAYADSPALILMYLGQEKERILWSDIESVLVDNALPPLVLEVGRLLESDHFAYTFLGWYNSYGNRWQMASEENPTPVYTDTMQRDLVLHARFEMVRPWIDEIDDIERVYDGTTNSITATAKQSAIANMSVVYEWQRELSDWENIEVADNALQVRDVADSGNYRVRATVTDAHDRSSTTAWESFAVKISKRVIDTSALTLPSAEFEWDGTAKYLQVEGEVPDGVNVVYQNNGQSEGGRYEVTALFETDFENNSVSVLYLTSELIVENQPGVSDSWHYNARQTDKLVSLWLILAVLGTMLSFGIPFAVFEKRKRR